eukprot:CAMPEP_0119034086 /NCGR_PEP_ID=MMETSP1177-20130426/1134_1 /TAXON_ID=2985 /ORGANISM="Ochromonas sp, Strain CCMP1899" /LENGTH=542 /DNA_ID=CAMNT_0006991317 /DNA_START=802 /DNA_END=2430 /DNA_ORIENTATION=+
MQYVLNPKHAVSLIQSDQGNKTGPHSVPIPIPGTGSSPSQQPFQSSSEKTQRSNFPPNKDTENCFPTGHRLGSDSFRGGAERIQGPIGSYQENHQRIVYQQLEGNNTNMHGISRSLDSRPQEMAERLRQEMEEQNYQSRNKQRIAQNHRPRLDEEERDVYGAERGDHSLSTPPKHPNYSRQSFASVAGSYTSDFGTSPGGGMPFYLPGSSPAPSHMMNAASTSSTASPRREDGYDGSDGRVMTIQGSRSSTGEGNDVNPAGSGVSPPYQEVSTQLLSTSPQVGDRAMTLYRLNNPQMRVHSGKDDGNRENSQLQQQQQLLKNLQVANIAPENMSINLKIALPRSPFETSPTFHGDSSNRCFNNLAVRTPRSQVLSRDSGKSPREENENTVGSCGVGVGLDGVGTLLEAEGRTTSFSFNEEDEEDDDDDDLQEEDEDMPFAWVQSESTVFTNCDDINSNKYDQDKYDPPQGDVPSSYKDKNSTPQSLSQSVTSSRMIPAAYPIPPSLLSFLDVPWYESGNAAVATAIYKQLDDYKEFRTSFPP